MLRWDKLPVSPESSLESELAGELHCSLSGPSPTGSTAGSTARRVAQPRLIPKAPPPYNLTGAPRPRNRAQVKEQSKASERELSKEEIANLSDGDFRALVIKMFTELIELGQKMKKINERYPK